MESVKLATKLTPAIKAWIKEETNNDAIYSSLCIYVLSNNGKFIFSYNLGKDYTEVSEQEFLSEFRKPKVIIQIKTLAGWRNCIHQENFRIKPTPDYSKEIEALQAKAKENGMKVTINFDKI